MRTTSVSINGAGDWVAVPQMKRTIMATTLFHYSQRKTTYDLERTKNEAVVRTRDARGDRNRRCRADRRRISSRADSVTRETSSGGRSLQKRPGAQGHSCRRFPADDGDHGGRPSIRLLGLSRRGRHGQGRLGGGYSEKTDGSQYGEHGRHHQ